MSERDLPKYRPKLRRPQPGEERYREPAGIRIKDVDIQIMDLCYKHRFLTSRMLYALAHGKKEQLKKRLQLLWLHKYLVRPPDQEILRVREGLRYLIYGLGNKGAKVLAERKGYDIEKVRWSQRNQVKFPFIRHTLFVSQFFTCLDLALRKKHEMDLLWWKQGTEIEARIKKPPYMSTRTTRADRPLLRPDALFGIHYLDEDKRQFVYLECDRGTVRERTLLKRYREYWALWEQRGFVKQGIPEELGFRVLTVSTNPTRAENLRKLIEENEPWDGKTSMFWFTWKQWDIENPKPILGKVWKIAEDEELHSIAD